MLQAALALRVDQHELVQACWRSLECAAAPVRVAPLPRAVQRLLVSRPGERQRARERGRPGAAQTCGQLGAGHAPGDGRRAAPGGRPMTEADAPGRGDAEQAAEGRPGPRRGQPHRPPGAARFPRLAAAGPGATGTHRRGPGRRMRSRLTPPRRFDPRGNLLDLRKTLRPLAAHRGNSVRAGLAEAAQGAAAAVPAGGREPLQWSCNAQLFLRIARAFAAVMHAGCSSFHTRLAEVTAWLTRPSGGCRRRSMR